MQKKELSFSYDVYDSIDELNAEDAALLREARAATAKAHAPYSHFRVGAAARLVNGQHISGANQENASFPAGLCAEGVVMATASALHPRVPIETLAISYESDNGPSNRPISPCGICRQSMQEFEQKTGRPVRLLLGAMEGKIFVIPESNFLLPFAFTAHEL